MHPLHSTNINKSILPGFIVLQLRRNEETKFRKEMWDNTWKDHPAMVTIIPCFMIWWVSYEKLFSRKKWACCSFMRNFFRTLHLYILFKFKIQLQRIDVNYFSCARKPHTSVIKNNKSSKIFDELSLFSSSCNAINISVPSWTPSSVLMTPSSWNSTIERELVGSQNGSRAEGWPIPSDIQVDGYQERGKIQRIKPRSIEYSYGLPKAV